MKFEKLLQSGAIGKMRLKNRIVMLPMATGLAGVNGEVSDETVAHYERRAEGGAALITVEATFTATAVDPMSGKTPTLRADDDYYLAGLFRLTEAVHEAGSKISIQLKTGLGSQATFHTYKMGVQGIEKVRMVSCSPVPRLGDPAPRELSIEECQKIIELFGMAAARVKLAGFDALEICAHGGYLTAQFLSPYFNKRADKYGGSFEGRLRFLLEIIESAKKAVGDDFPIVVRYGIDERMEGGRDIEESKLIAKRLQQVGVSAISADVGLGKEVGEFIFPPSYMPKGFAVGYAKAIKDAVAMPVITACRLGDPELAEKVLAEGNADFVGLGRPLLADPDLPKKVQSGHPEEIRRCISCNECKSQDRRSMRCALNAMVGRETKYGKISKTGDVKRVMVVGAGPGGMEAARVLALRGHKVTLYEKTSELGGQLKAASIPPSKDVLNNITSYYSVQLRKLENVTVHLGKEVTAELVEKEKPDVVVIATGARPIIPKIPGVRKKNVVIDEDVLLGRATVGREVVIVGGGSKGCEVANFLAEHGKTVRVLEKQGEAFIFARDLDDHARKMLMMELTKKDVRLLPNKSVVEITDQGVVIEDNKQNREVIRADTVVLSCGSHPVNELVDKLAGKVDELYVIGDAKEPQRIREAVSSGFVVGFKL